MISVNECDPLRDEGMVFYRRLMASWRGLRAAAKCAELAMRPSLLINICPDISGDTAADLARFAKANA